MKKGKLLIKGLLRRLGIFVFRSGSLPRNVSILQDLERFCSKFDFGRVLDVGANVGQTSTMFLEWFPNAQIDSFEPAKETYSILRESTQDCQRVKCHHLGLSDRTGHGEMNVRGNSLFSTLEVDASMPIEDGYLQSVRLETLNDWWEQNGTDSIDLLKLGAQGHELPILKGADLLLRDNRINFILCEVGFSARSREIAFLGDIYDFLMARNFIFYGLYDPRDWSNQVGITWADALFVHRSKVSG